LWGKPAGNGGWGCPKHMAKKVEVPCQGAEVQKKAEKTDRCKKNGTRKGVGSSDLQRGRVATTPSRGHTAPG